MAVIGALEARRTFPDTPMSLYTVGAPRVGNTAFAGHLSEVLPDSWALVNLNDPVRRQNKIDGEGNREGEIQRGMHTTGWDADLQGRVMPVLNSACPTLACLSVLRSRASPSSTTSALGGGWSSASRATCWCSRRTSSCPWPPRQVLRGRCTLLLPYNRKIAWC